MSDIFQSAGLLILGGLATYVVRNFFEYLNAEKCLIDDHIEDICAIEELSTKYWLMDLSLVEQHNIHETKLEMKDLSSRIEGKLTASSYFEETAEKIFRQKYKEYEDLDFLLYDLTTGDDFGDTNKVSDPNRVVEIIKTCNKMRLMLRKSRQSLFWFR